MAELRRGLVLAAMALAGLASFASRAAAQAPTLDVVSFEEAVQRAIQANLTVQRAATAVLGAEALLAQARAAVRPSIDGAATVTTLDGERGFSGNVVQPRTQLLLGGSAAMPLLASAQWAARLQAADQVTVASVAVHDVRRQVGVAAAEAYLAVIARKRQLEVNVRARDTAKAQLDYATARREGGVGSRLNELRAAQELAVDEELVERATLAVQLGQEALGVLLAADKAVDTAGPPALETPAADGEGWLVHRTDIKLFDARIDAAGRVVADSWRDWVPTVRAAFEPQYITPAGLFQPSGTWRAVVAANVPLFDAGRRRAAKSQREASLALFRVERQDAELRAKSDVRIARTTIDAEAKALGRAREAAGHAGEVLRITDVAFRAGATTNIELVDAQRRARDAESAVAQAEDRARSARLALLVALGRFPG
ncbi:MAG: TolC family protein [Acidobacteria bacterium]|nr:TolC family protein [Acidobacteriota bacterium]